MELDDIRSNYVRRCVDCGIPITPSNDSGWEVFVGDGKQTQPICCWCDIKRNEEPIEKEKSVEDSQ